MKKKLFTLLVCAFAAIGANAWTVSFNADRSVATITSDQYNTDNWSEIRYTGLNEGEDGATLLKGASTLNFVSGTTITSLLAFQSGGFAATTVDFSGAIFEETDGEVINYTAWNPTDGYHSASVTTTSNAMTFSYFPQVENAILANVQSICPGCFKSSNQKMTGTFTIPSTVKYIARLAIEDIPLSNITIPDNVEYIASKAFQNGDIKALIDVTVEGYTYAANEAFDKQTTVGQTDAGYGNYATLHFNPGAEEFFQSNKDPLTQVISLDRGKFQSWLQGHFDNAATGENPNGWREFVNASSTPPTPVPVGKKVVLRTFSDNVARIVPLDFRAYLVSGVTKLDDDNYKVDLVQIFAIPAYTGVILYGEIDERSTSFSMATIPSWDDKNSKDYVAPYTRTSPDVEIPDADRINYVSTRNYMVPILEDTKLYPYYKDMTDDDWKSQWPLPAGDGLKNKYSSGTTVTDRNFILTNLKGTTLSGKQTDDYVGFFRVKPNVVCGANKAYLSLPSTGDKGYKNPAGAEALVIKPTSPDSYIFRSDKWNDSFTTTGNWGQRDKNIGVLSAIFAGEIFEEETGIQNVATESVDGGYYTLQGVKVAQPQKGVYVKNGKKVIIK